jgi:hypothetical protein
MNELMRFEVLEGCDVVLSAERTNVWEELNGRIKSGITAKRKHAAWTRGKDSGFHEGMGLFVDLHANALNISLLKKGNKLRNVLKSEFIIMQSLIGIDILLNLKPAITYLLPRQIL